MSKMFILTKDNEYSHTYSGNVVNNLEKEGWHMIMSISGWNMSGPSYLKLKCDGCDKFSRKLFSDNDKDYCKRCLDEIESTR